MSPGCSHSLRFCSRSRFGQGCNPSWDGSNPGRCPSPEGRGQGKRDGRGRHSRGRIQTAQGQIWRVEEPRAPPGFQVNGGGQIRQDAEDLQAVEEWGAQRLPRRLRGAAGGAEAGQGASCSLLWVPGPGDGQGLTGRLPGPLEPCTYQSCCQKGRSQGQPREGPWCVAQQVRWGLPEGPPIYSPSPPITACPAIPSLS